jgi:hypothetical protein
MMEQDRSYHIVFNAQGQVLAIAPAEVMRTNRGMEMGSRPLPLPGQDVLETGLPAEFQGRSLAELLDAYEPSVDVTTRQVRFTPRDRAG